MAVDEFIAVLRDWSVLVLHPFIVAALLCLIGTHALAFWLGRNHGRRRTEREFEKRLLAQKLRSIGPDAASPARSAGEMASDRGAESAELVAQSESHGFRSSARISSAGVGVEVREGRPKCQSIVLNKRELVSESAVDECGLGKDREPEAQAATDSGERSEPYSLTGGERELDMDPVGKEIVEMFNRDPDRIGQPYATLPVGLSNAEQLYDRPHSDALFASSTTGNFWLVRRGLEEDLGYLVPRPGLVITPARVLSGGVGSAFHVEGYREGFRYEKFLLRAPATMLRNGEYWRVARRGTLVVEHEFAE